MMRCNDGNGDVVVVEVAVDKSATVSDEAVDIAVDEVTVSAEPEVIWSRSRRTPPALMLRWTLANLMSIPPLSGGMAPGRPRPWKTCHDKAFVYQIKG
jgi:hypothetical protein